jgi:nicotinamide mononucleotide transporter
MIYFEVFGVIAYFLSVYFAIKVNSLTWISGIVSSILFGIIYFDSQTYANASLQIILIFVSINGWLNWRKKNTKKISNLSWLNKLLLFIVSALCILIFGSVINIIPNISDPYPYLDMTIFVLSIIGTILLSLKKIENWYIWILVNIASLILYVSLGFYLIGAQSIVFIIMDIIALKKWRKEYENRISFR